MAKYKMLDGNGAAVEAISKADVKVIAAYPITPQSTISEKLSDLVADGTIKAQYIRVESEHSAMSVTMSAQMTGVRAATATASNGLALMHEMLIAASGQRAPIVMPVVNRAIASPWSLWCDHQDSLAERDSGWLQFYCENCQEVFDLTCMAYRVAENEKVLLPAMVCLDGFFLSHSMQKVSVPSNEEMSAFIGPYVKKNMWVDPADPITINNLTSNADFTEMKYQMHLGFKNAGAAFEEAAAEYKERFGREYHLAEGYKTEDAEIVIVSMGSMAGTVKYMVDQWRKAGKKVGAIKITCFRPFPKKEVAELLKNAKKVAVFDRSAGLGGTAGPLYQEVYASLTAAHPVMKDYTGGQGGRDVSPATLNKVLEDIEKTEETDNEIVWIDVKENAMEIREVTRNV